MWRRRWRTGGICRVLERSTHRLPSRGCLRQGQVRARRQEWVTPNHQRRRLNQPPQSCNKRSQSPLRGHRSGRAGSPGNPPRRVCRWRGRGWLVGPLGNLRGGSLREMETGTSSTRVNGGHDAVVVIAVDAIRRSWPGFAGLRRHPTDTLVRSWGDPHRLTRVGPAPIFHVDKSDLFN